LVEQVVRDERSAHEQPESEQDVRLETCRDP